MIAISYLLIAVSVAWAISAPSTARKGRGYRYRDGTSTMRYSRRLPMLALNIGDLETAFHQPHSEFRGAPMHPLPRGQAMVACALRYAMHHLARLGEPASILSAETVKEARCNVVFPRPLHLYR